MRRDFMSDDRALGAKHPQEDKLREIESVMESRSSSYVFPPGLSNSSKELEPVLTEAFISQPIVGNISIGRKQRKLLNNEAKYAFSQALNSSEMTNYGLNSFDCDVILLNTVLLLQSWNKEEDDTNEGEGLWEFIFNQYASTYYKGSSSREYKIFRYAIERSLNRHKRLFVEQGHSYYTTLLAHALAPKSKFYALFEQIFDFYARTLSYQYKKNDPVFRDFSIAMAKRFSGRHSRLDDDVYIKSVQSSSAIKALFSNCPEYMSAQVEHVVHAIDGLVSTGKIEKKSYLDKLLSDWYQERSKETRETDKQNRKRESSERVVTEFSNIRPVYRYENNEINLVIPAIRLGPETNDLPWIKIYRSPDDQEPYSKRLEYYGNYIVITSARTLIPIKKIITKDSVQIEPRVVISYGAKEIYDSEMRLFRQALVFDERGNELSKRPDNTYVEIYVTANSRLEGQETSHDCTLRTDEGINQWSVRFDGGTSIRVNGVSLFPLEEKIDEEISLILSHPPLSRCKYVSNNQEYDIFVNPTQLKISVEDSNLLKQYRMKINDEIYPLLKYCNDSGTVCSVDLPSSEDCFHEITIIDNSSHDTVYALQYLYIPHFSVHFNGFYYHENYVDNGSIDLFDKDGKVSYLYTLSEDQSMYLPYRDGELSIDVPRLICRLDGVELEEDPSRIIWKDDIEMHVLLEIDVPSGYSGSVMIGTKVFKPERVEIGNEIRTRNDSDIETVGVILRRQDDNPVEIKLFDVAYNPCFRARPIEVEGQNLLWCVEDNFIGPIDSIFKLNITFQGKALESIEVSNKDEIIKFENFLEEGVYDYDVFVKTPGLISTFEKMFSGKFVIGDPHKFRFDSREIIITEAVIGQDFIKLERDLGIISKLRYVGLENLSGETNPYPCYEGNLQYKDDGKRRSYSKEEVLRNGAYYEPVNPIKVWVINEYLIALRNSTGDGPYINKKWRSITDRAPNNFNKQHYDNADYFSFEEISPKER